MEVAGQVVIVTGGAGGIGAALCRRLAAANVECVVVADLDAEGAERVSAGIGGIAFQADVTKEAEVGALVAKVLASFGRIDIYCSNAGVGVHGGPEAPDDVWQKAWEVHVMAHVYAARAVLPGMLARGRGYFLGTASAAGLLNHILAAPYAATKAAEISFLEWLAIRHGARGLRVSALCPLGVRTPMLEMAGTDPYFVANALHPDVVADAVVAGLRDERFLILPQPEVAEYFRRRATDHQRWLRGMQRIEARVHESSNPLST